MSLDNVVLRGVFDAKIQLLPTAEKMTRFSLGKDLVTRSILSEKMVEKYIQTNQSIEPLVKQHPSCDKQEREAVDVHKKRKPYDCPVMEVIFINMEQGIASGSGPEVIQPGEPTDVEHEWNETFIEEREVQW